MSLPGDSIVAPPHPQDASTSSIRVHCKNGGVSSSEATRVSIILQGYGPSKSLDVVWTKGRKPRILINYDLRTSALAAACGFREKGWVIKSPPMVSKARRKFFSNMTPEEVTRASVVDIIFAPGLTVTEPEVYATLCPFGIIDAVITYRPKSRPSHQHVFVKFVNFDSAFEVIDFFTHESWRINPCCKELFSTFEKIMLERALDALDDSEKPSPPSKKPNLILRAVTDTKSLEQIQRRRNAKPKTVVPIPGLGDHQKMREYPRGVQTATERQPSTTIFMTRGIAPWLRQEAAPDFENQPLSPPEAVPLGDGTSPSEGAEALTNIRTAPPITNVPSVSTGSSVEDSGSEIDALERTPIKALGSLWQIGYPYTDTEMSTLYEMPLWKVKLRPLAPAKISPSFPPNPFLPVTEPVLSPSMRYTPEQARPVTVPSPPHTLYPCSPRPVICPQLTQGYATDMHKPGKSDDHIPQLGKRQRDVESEEDWDEHKSTTGTLITESQRGTSNAEKAVASVVTDAQRAALLMRQFAKRRCLVREEEDGMGD